VVNPKRSQILSAVLILIGVIALFFAEDNWVSGDYGRSLTLTLLGLAPLIWGLWLRRKKPEGKVG
jgi:hypothetical protein